jgi:hypothetical protein
LAMLVVGDFGQLILIQPPWGKNTDSELPVVDVARLADNLTRELIPWWQRLFFRRRIEVLENHDEHLLDAAVVSVGRFGIVYAYVLEAHDESMRAIVEKRERSSWEDVRDVNPLTGQIRLIEQIDFGRTTDGFLQIVVNPYTDDSGRHVCFITTHEIEAGSPTDPVFAPELDYVMDRRAHRGTHGFIPLMQLFCADRVTEPVRVLMGVLTGLAAEAINTGALGGTLLAPIVGPIASLAGVSVGIYVSSILLSAVDSLGRINPNHVVGDVIADMLNRIRGDNIPVLSSMIIELVTSAMLESEQKPWNVREDWDPVTSAPRRNVKGTRFEIADFFDYEHDCYRGDSVEIFFAANVDLADKISRMLDIFQELRARNLQVGAYISMRFMARTRALLGMAQFDMTCAVEIAMIRGITGNQEALALLQEFALHNDGLIHWGQQNDRRRTDVEQQFSRNLDLWRAKFSSLAMHLERSYTPFSQQHGLYVLRAVDSSAWGELGITGRNSPAVVSAGAGQPLQIFTLDSDRKLHTLQRDGSGSLGTWQEVQPDFFNAATSPVVHRDPSGQIELFIRASDKRIKHSWQMIRAGGDFSAWDTKGLFNPGFSDSDVSVVTHLDGRIEIFSWAAASTPPARQLLHVWQRWAGDARAGQWSEVFVEGTGMIESPPGTCFRRFSGTSDQLVVVAFRGNAVVEMHHRGADWVGGWTDWTRITPSSGPIPSITGLGGPIAFTRVAGADHIVHVLAIDVEGEVHETTEANLSLASWSWSAWQQLPTTNSFRGLDPNGRMSVVQSSDQVFLFGRSREGEVLVSKFQAMTGWSMWRSLGAEVDGNVVVGFLPDGRIDIVARRASDNHLIVHRLDPSTF